MNANSRQGWRTYSGVTLILTALLLFPNTFAFAQTQEPQTQTPSPSPAPPSAPPSEVEQLKKRLQQLEQTVVELKGQIDTLETKKKDPAPAVMNATYTERPAVETASAAPAEPAKP